MQLFLVAFQQPIPFGISAIIVITMIYIILRSAMTAEGGSTWVRKVTNPNAKFLFTFLFIVWAVVFGIGLIALFSGFFIMMGLLWAVIGE